LFPESGRRKPAASCRRRPSPSAPACPASNGKPFGSSPFPAAVPGKPPQARRRAAACRCRKRGPQELLFVHRVFLLCVCFPRLQDGFYTAAVGVLLCPGLRIVKISNRVPLQPHGLPAGGQLGPELVGQVQLRPFRVSPATGYQLRVTVLFALR